MYNEYVITYTQKVEIDSGNDNTEDQELTVLKEVAENILSEIKSPINLTYAIHKENK